MDRGQFNLCQLNKKTKRAQRIDARLQAKKEKKKIQTLLVPRREGEKEAVKKTNTRPQLPQFFKNQEGQNSNRPPPPSKKPAPPLPSYPA